MLIVAVVFLILLLLNMPVAFAIGIASLCFILLEPGLPTEIVIQRMVTGTQSFPLLAVPFFYFSW